MDLEVKDSDETTSIGVMKEMIDHTNERADKPTTEDEKAEDHREQQPDEPTSEEEPTKSEIRST